jgi:hypothetical protein
MMELDKKDLTYALVFDFHFHFHFHFDYFYCQEKNITIKLFNYYFY